MATVKQHDAIKSHHTSPYSLVFRQLSVFELIQTARIQNQDLTHCTNLQGHVNVDRYIFGVFKGFCSYCLTLHFVRN